MSQFSISNIDEALKKL